MAPLPLDEIQGFILKGYNLETLRIVPLRVKRAADAKRCLASLVDQNSSAPQLTTGRRNGSPEYGINIGFTSEGLRALGVRAPSLRTFPEEFRLGAAARADVVGDSGASSPVHWDEAFKAESRLHALLFIYAKDDNTRTGVSNRLGAALSAGFTTLSAPYDSERLPNQQVHFGFRDGIAQPTIAGTPRSRRTDPLPEAKAGEFLLGYPSQYDRHMYTVPTPSELGENGSFLAFRLLHQDCDGFERFLDDAEQQTGLPRELIMAKLCGRWPSGVPLSLSPDQDNPQTPADQYNDFDYNGDPDGVACPIGSHIRRMNPRSSPVMGGANLKRRIIRRGMPFGTPHVLNDGKERGLLGVFICVSLKDQFEFLMSKWTNDGAFGGMSVRGTRDPIHGDNGVGQGEFRFPTRNGIVRLTGLSRFVTCRGAAYCFLPSVTGIRYLAR